MYIRTLFGNCLLHFLNFQLHCEAKMFGGTGNIMTTRFSKLRKRDEPPVPPNTPEIATTLHKNFSPICSHNVSDANQNYRHHELQEPLNANDINILDTFHGGNNIFVKHKHVTFVRTSGMAMDNAKLPNDGTSTNNQWVFPPKAPSPNVYNCFNNEALQIADDKSSLKGLRKQFSGRFKRFVAKKADTRPSIPAELKPQLKTIYVY